MQLVVATSLITLVFNRSVSKIWLCHCSWSVVGYLSCGSHLHETCIVIVFLFYSSLGVFCWFAWLRAKLFNDCLVSVFRLQSHTTLLSSSSLQFYFFTQQSVCDCTSWAASSIILFLCNSFLTSSVFNIYSKTLRRKESKPLKSLLI